MHSWRRQQKVQDEHGCRHQKWWLVDDNGHEHLAVVGDEREPRDGHYTYVAEKPFALIRPLNCQNQAKVTSYLEDVSIQAYPLRAPQLIILSAVHMCQLIICISCLCIRVGF
jgi:hypothetical protein